MNRPVKKTIALLLCVVLTTALFSGCAQMDVRKMIGRFEATCQKVDAEAMMDCINPSVIQPVRSVLSLLGVDDLNTVVTNIFGTLGYFDGIEESPEEVLSTLKITPKALVFNDAKNQCHVTAVLEYQITGEKKSETVILDCGLENDQWYIMDIKK